MPAVAVLVLLTHHDLFVVNVLGWVMFVYSLLQAGESALDVQRADHEQAFHIPSPFAYSFIIFLFLSFPCRSGRPVSGEDDREWHNGQAGGRGGTAAEVGIGEPASPRRR